MDHRRLPAPGRLQRTGYREGPTIGGPRTRTTGTRGSRRSRGKGQENGSQGGNQAEGDDEGGNPAEGDDEGGNPAEGDDEVSSLAEADEGDDAADDQAAVEAPG